MMLATELPKRSSTPPKTWTVPVPRPDWFWATSVPALRMTPPVKVLVPERISVPAPALVRTPAPDRTPANSRLPETTLASTAEARVTPVETTWVPAADETAALPVVARRVRAPAVPRASV